MAERLSAARTKTEGFRALDTLQVATALHLNAKEFLSFDERQRKLAAAEGLLENLRTVQGQTVTSTSG